MGYDSFRLASSHHNEDNVFILAPNNHNEDNVYCEVNCQSCRRVKWPNNIPPWATEGKIRAPSYQQLEFMLADLQCVELTDGIYGCPLCRTAVCKKGCILNVLNMRIAGIDPKLISNAAIPEECPNEPDET